MQQKVSIIDRASYWVIRMGIVCMVIFAAMAVSGNNPHEIAPSINQHATVLSDKTQRDNKSEAGSITQSNIKIDQLPDSSLPVFLTMPVTSTKAENLKIANMIFNDQYKFAEFLKDVFYFPGGKIDYDVQSNSAQDSNRLWMQSLTPISHLCNAYESTKEKKYLQRIDRLLKDWEAYAVRGKNKYLWFDHTVANRVHTLIYYYVLADSAKLFDDHQKRHLVELLARHADFLADPKNYSNYNHGVMMDKALLLVSLFLKPSLPDHSREWYTIAIHRISNDFQRDYTPSRIHIENSTSYHFYVTRHFSQMVELLNYYHIQIPENINNSIAGARNYERVITKPDGKIPLIGDTNDTVVKTSSSLSSAVYPDAGVAVFCSPAQKTIDSTWMMFKSGYITSIHKHADDLSFVLYGGGQDIFTDGGLLNYQSKDPYTDYIISALAHNLVVVDNQSYPIEKRNLSAPTTMTWTLFPQAGILSHEIAEDIERVTGFNNSYPGVSLQRTLLFLKPDIIILYDTAESTSTHTYSQLFRIAHKMRIARLNDEEMMLASETNNNMKVSMLQMFPAQSSIYNGDHENIRGFASIEFDTLIPTPQVAFSVKGNHSEFITIIGINKTTKSLKEYLSTIIKITPEKISLTKEKNTLGEIRRIQTKTQ